LGRDGVGFLTTLDKKIRLRTKKSDSESGGPIGSFLHYTLKLRIPVEMDQFSLKLLLKQIFLAVQHDFHRF